MLGIRVVRKHAHTKYVGPIFFDSFSFLIPCRMKATYDINDNLMCLLRASHDALACPQGFDAYCTSRILPLHMSIDDATPLSPDHVELE